MFYAVSVRYIYICIIPYNFLVCNIILNLYVSYINILCCICKIYIYSNVWFQCKTSECLVSFKFLSMSCMGSFQWPFHYKKLLLSNKNICWATYLCSCDPFVSFSRAVNYIVILLYFQFTPTLVFTICPMLNIGDSSIRCLEKNTDVHQQIQTLIVKTDHLALKLGSKK